MALLRRKTEAALLVLAALVVMVALISLEISQGNELTGSVFLLIGTLVFLRDHRSLENYSYVLGLAGLILTALPIVWPSATNADAAVWISIGPFSIQPG